MELPKGYTYRQFLFVSVFSGFLLVWIAFLLLVPKTSATPDFSDAVEAGGSGKIVLEPAPSHAGKIWEGIASYYSLSGCVGCREDRKMANGEVLNDEGLTVAFNKAKLNSFVAVTNKKTGKSVVAKVTDRGGFERLGRIIDLSVAVRNHIGCSDLCSVIIEEAK